MHIAHPNPKRRSVIAAAGRVYGPRGYGRRKGQDSV